MGQNWCEETEKGLVLFLKKYWRKPQTLWFGSTLNGNFSMWHRWSY